MVRETWDNRINAKFFYVRTYRWTGRALLLSLFINFLLCLGIYYLHFHETIRDYYATSGMTPPIKLNPLDEPNYSATPLLAADPVNDEAVKMIPD